MLNSDTFNKIEKQLEYSLYLALTICLISLYVSFTIYEKQKPLRELNTLKSYITLYNHQSINLLLKTRQSESKIFANSLKKKIDKAVQNQLNYKINWGLYTMNSNLDKLLFPIANTNVIIPPDVTITQVLDKLIEDVKIVDFKNIKCETKKNKNEENEVHYYYNVKNVSVIDSTHKMILNLEILIGKSRELNTLTFGEQFNIKCFCDIDTATIKSKNKSKWVETNFPWIFNHLNEIGGTELKDFNQFWEGKLTGDFLKEEQNLLGLKFQNYSLTIITIVLLLSIFTFHLSLLSELIKHKSELPSDFSIPVLYKNSWGKLLRFFVWIIIPLSSIFMSGYFISSSYLVMTWIIPTLILGIIILRNINKLTR